MSEILSVTHAPVRPGKGPGSSEAPGGIFALLVRALQETAPAESQGGSVPLRPRPLHGDAPRGRLGMIGQLHALGRDVGTVAPVVIADSLVGDAKSRVHTDQVHVTKSAAPAEMPPKVTERVIAPSSASKSSSNVPHETVPSATRAPLDVRAAMPSPTVNAAETPQQNERSAPRQPIAPNAPGQEHALARLAGRGDAGMLGGVLARIQAIHAAREGAPDVRTTPPTQLRSAARSSRAPRSSVEVPQVFPARARAVTAAPQAPTAPNSPVSARSHLGAAAIPTSNRSITVHHRPLAGVARELYRTRELALPTDRVAMKHDPYLVGHEGRPSGATNVAGQLAAKMSSDVGVSTDRQAPVELAGADVLPRSGGEQDLVGRLHQAVSRLLGQEPRTGQLSVTIPGAGEVDVDVARRPDGTARVTLAAATDAAKKLLDGVRGTLVEELRASGLPVVHVQVQKAAGVTRRARRTRADSLLPPAISKPAPASAAALQTNTAGSVETPASPRAFSAALPPTSLSTIGLEAGPADAQVGPLEAGSQTGTRAVAQTTLESVTATLRPRVLARAVSGLVTRALADGATEARLVLNPPDLGQVRIRISERDGNIRLLFEVQSVAVRESLTGAQPELQDLLERQGLKMTDFTVDVGGRQSDARQANGHGPGSRATGSRELVDGDEPPAESERPRLGRVDVLA